MQESHYVNQKRVLSTQRDKGNVEGVPEYLHIISGDGTSTSVLLGHYCVTTSSHLNIKQQIYPIYILETVPERLQSNQLILYFILFFRLDRRHHLEVVFFQMSKSFMRRGPAENCPTVRRHLHRFALSGCSEGGRADKPLTAL